MAVKHTPTGVVDQGAKGGNTGCGVDTRKHSDHWVSSSQRITVIKMDVKTKAI